MNSNFSIVDGIACYHKGGEGPCILWLHGYTMNASIWSNVQNLLPEYSHLAIDLPGHGRSCSIREFKDLPSLAGHVTRLALAFNVKVIFGLSFGGILGLQMAVEAPEGFDMLILNSAPIGGGPIDAFAQSKNLELIRLYKSKADPVTMRNAWMSSPPDIFSGAKPYPLLWSELAAMIDQHRWEELDGNLFSLFNGFDQTKCALGKIKFPVKLIIGDNDMDNIKRCTELIKRAIKNSERIYIPDAGHLAILEQPQYVSSIIAGCLAQQKQKPGR